MVKLFTASAGLPALTCACISRRWLLSLSGSTVSASEAVSTASAGSSLWSHILERHSRARTRSLSSLSRSSDTQPPSTPERNGRQLIASATVAGPKALRGSSARIAASATSRALVAASSGH